MKVVTVCKGLLIKMLIIGVVKRLLLKIGTIWKMFIKNKRFVKSNVSAKIILVFNPSLNNN